ncbi:unnamed protein product, partial [Oppiella nova]
MGNIPGKSKSEKLNKSDKTKKKDKNQSVSSETSFKTLPKDKQNRPQDNGHPLPGMAPNGKVLIYQTSSKPCPLPLPPPPAPVAIDNPENIVIAMYAYRAEHTGDLTFRKGEKLEVLERSDPDWWTVRRIETGEIGYIPANYVGTTVIESEDWYYGCIGRRAAEKLLLYGEYPAGTFLIRLSEHNTPDTLKSYALSIRDYDPMVATGKHNVKHYQIKETPHDTYSMANREFRFLHEIVQFYSTHPGGLCHSLGQPCPKPLPGIIPPGRTDEIDRKDLKMI